MAHQTEEELITYGGYRYSTRVFHEEENTLYQLSKIQTGSTAGSSFSPWPSKENEVIVINSVTSGTGCVDGCDFYTNVMQPILSDLNIQYEYVETTGPDTVTRFADGFTHPRPQTVMILSGDTTISEFVNGLDESCNEVSVLPIPLGTGNAWASSLGYRSPTHALSCFLKGMVNESRFPLYNAIFPNGDSLRFFIVLSLGFHANLLHLCEAPKYKAMGVERFKEAGTEIIDSYSPAERVRLTNSSGEEFKAGTYSYIVVINTCRLEPTYMPSPLSNALEQKLRLLCYDASLDKQALTAKIMQGYTNEEGQSISGPGTTYVELPDNFTLSVDNDISERTKFEICIDGKLLNLLDMRRTDGVRQDEAFVRIENCSTFSQLKVFHPSSMPKNVFR